MYTSQAALLAQPQIDVARDPREDLQEPAGLGERNVRNYF